MRMNGGRSGAKRMRRRGGGGGAKPRSLRLDVESAIDKCSTVDQLVNHLRLAVPRYERYKVRPFTKSVAKIVADLSRKYSDMDDGHGGDIPITKRRIWTNEKDEKLTVTETQHSGVLNHSVGGPSSTVTSDTYSEGENEKASLSSDDDDDAIYQEKLEPQFDLLKSILRENLCRKTRKSVDGERREVKQVMEMEVVEHHKDDKDMVHLTKMNGESGDLNVNKINNNNDRNGRNTNIRREKIMLSDFGGIDGVIDELISKVIWPFYHPEMPHRLGVKPITGILLHGPPGCGKTTMAEAIANETGVALYKISAAALVSGVSGASEENIRELFSKAIRTAPSIVFIDEIDAIASKRENSRGMELRIVTQLLTCMDESRNLVKLVNDNTCSESSNRRPGFVLVIGATNRPDALDPALRRPGRFDREFILSVPDVSARAQILSKLTCNVKTEGHLDLVKIARSTPGFVGADLEGLVDEAGRLAMRRLKHKREAELYKEPKDGACNKHWWQASISEEEMGVLMITMDDFEEALKTVQPSCRREGFSHIPNVTWDDIGGLHLLRKEFDRYIIRPIKFPEVYENHGLDLDTGFLLYGPPGCGKTLIAKAVANEAGANFIHIKGPDLLSKYVGDSELAVRTIFDRARRCSPCIIFFDEVDALTTRRGKEGGWVVERVVNQLLVELDGGADHRKGVYVIGATNRPDVVDSALLRPGRIGKLVYVPLPNPDERGMILKALARNKKIDGNVDLMAIGKDSTCDNFSGADLSNLVNEAAFLSLEEQSSNTNEVHFKRALEKISPSVSQEQINYYNLLSKSVKTS